MSAILKTIWGKIKVFFSSFKQLIRNLDKQTHFLAGIVVGTYGATFTDSFFLGILFAALAGITKEVYDKISHKGTPDYWDFIFTVLGGVFGCIGYSVLKACLIYYIR